MGRCGNLTLCAIFIFFRSFITGTETNSSSTMATTIFPKNNLNEPTELPVKNQTELNPVNPTSPQPSTTQGFTTFTPTTESKSAHTIWISPAAASPTVSIVTTVNLESSRAPIKPTSSSSPSSSSSESIFTTLSDSSVQDKAHLNSPSALNIGDAESSHVPPDPLLAGLLSSFVVIAALVSILLFLRFRNMHGGSPEFRPLQDLPMDDMLEDAPLSVYSY
ncbi:hypothetical protein DNTS_035840 [Danionella cerebrum]|uniref:Uncharacterized protein n=1 Tax=Danionella cerebrum TaxID=2873325 RepID=A0A553Q3I3_9TELE|nr:hypothetical protein DNTS_035840 [Danionella translucida]